MLKPFNKLSIFLTSTTIILAVMMSLIKSQQLAINILLIVQIINTALYLFYKTKLIKDDEYQVILKEANHDPSAAINEYPPLQLCNMGYVMIPIALLTRNQAVVAFCGFVYPFSTLMAVCMPCIGFEKYSIKKTRVFGYYFTHYMLMFSGISMWSARLYQPQYIDALYVLILLLLASIISHIYNILVSKYTSYKRINFLFTVSPAENPVLKLFRRLIPCQLIYMWPIALLLSIVFELIIIIIKI